MSGQIGHYFGHWSLVTFLSFWSLKKSLYGPFFESLWKSAKNSQVQFSQLQNFCCQKRSHFSHYGTQKSATMITSCIVITIFIYVLIGTTIMIHWKQKPKSVALLPTESESVYTLHRSKQSTRLREPALKPAKRPLLLVKCTNYSSNIKYDVWNKG